jgi:hypothetical protein
MCALSRHTIVDPLRHNITTTDRLPVPLGGFISHNIYEGQLHSSHNIVDHSCVAFIDMEKGKEKWQGKSFKVSIPAREPLKKYNVCVNRTQRRPKWQSGSPSDTTNDVSTSAL